MRYCVVGAPVEWRIRGVWGCLLVGRLAPLRCATLFRLQGGMSCSCRLNEGLAPLTRETDRGQWGLYLSAWFVVFLDLFSFGVV